MPPAKGALLSGVLGDKPDAAGSSAAVSSPPDWLLWTGAETLLLGIPSHSILAQQYRIDAKTGHPGARGGVGVSVDIYMLSSGTTCKKLHAYTSVDLRCLSLLDNTDNTGNTCRLAVCSRVLPVPVLQRLGSPPASKYVATESTLPSRTAWYTACSSTTAIANMSRWFWLLSCRIISLAWSHARGSVVMGAYPRALPDSSSNPGNKSNKPGICNALV